MGWVYSVLMQLVNVFLPFFSKFNKTISIWWHGRKTQIYPHHLPSPIWIHCASLGEFEQGRPVLEAIKKQWPHQAIVLTFFSPSGYEVRKNYEGADWVGYLPLDTLSNARSFIQTIKPKLVLFIKYEYWYHHMMILQQFKIPYFFVSSAWRHDNFLLKWWNRWLLDMVRQAEAFFVQDQQTQHIFLANHFKNIQMVGDTRIDRVIDLVSQPKPLPYFTELSFTNGLLVAGSTWPPDEKILCEFMTDHDAPSLVIAPHDTNTSRIQELKNLFGPYDPKVYSNWTGEYFKVLIIDNVGILNRLYAYAQAAYIGGGFGKGIHNTLEPASYGIPVFFGPRIERFREAKDMINLNTAFIIKDPGEFQKQWKGIFPSQLHVIKGKMNQYFAGQQGATAKIIDYLSPFIKST